MTADSLLALFVAVPLLVGGLLAAMPTMLRSSLTVMFTVQAAHLAASVAGVVVVADGSTVAHQISLWDSGIAIPFVLDSFSALMLTVTSLLTLTCSAFAVPSGEGTKQYFPSLVLIVSAGVSGALLTGDIFNFFVFIEVMLLASYGLIMITRPGVTNLPKVAASRLYISVNLLTSTMLLVGVGYIYGIVGTVNIAELRGAASEDTGVAIAGAVILFSLGIKAAVVPVHGWLPRVYPKMSPAITALFSGLHTKVAIYMIYRVYAVLFDGDARFLWVGVVAFSATMLFGVLGAVGENAPRSILAFHMVSQIGYILLGVALFGPLGLTAGIFYLLHHMVVKAALFLAIGAVEVKYGPRRLGQLQGLARTEPWVAVAFFAAAMSLAGIPPFSGFVAKLSLILAGIDAGQIAAVVVMVIVSLITLQSMLKIWSGVFLGEPGPVDDRTLPAAPAPADETSPYGENPSASTLTLLPERRRIGFALVAPALALACVTLAVGLGGQVLLDLSSTAAANLYDPSGYVEAVIGR